MDSCLLIKNKRKKSYKVNDCDLSLSKQTNKDFCATMKESWFFRLGMMKIMVGGENW